jgi:hypothetical protein
LEYSSSHGPQTQDCNGIYGGSAQLDACGKCEGNDCHLQDCDTYPNENFDCDGVCIAEGDNLINGLDCFDVCGGVAVRTWDSTPGCAIIDLNCVHESGVGYCDFSGTCCTGGDEGATLPCDQGCNLGNWYNDGETSVLDACGTCTGSASSASPPVQVPQASNTEVSPSLYQFPRLHP